jgi:WXG100 family type VII secretion target
MSNESFLVANYEEMQSAVSKIEQTQDDLNNQLQRMNGIMDRVSEVCQGKFAVSFQATWQPLLMNGQLFSVELEKMYRNLIKVQTDIRTTDETMAGFFRQK